MIFLPSLKRGIGGRSGIVIGGRVTMGSSFWRDTVRSETRRGTGFTRAFDIACSMGSVNLLPIVALRACEPKAGGM